MVAQAGDEWARVLLLGDPVAHSVSPAMHNAAFSALGLPLRYEARRVVAAELPRTLDDLRRPPYRGANVTVPHKEAVFDLVDEVTETAAAIGAVNTIVCQEGRLRGDNTDAQGLLAALQSALGMVPYGMRIVLLGAGGAARAAAVALLGGAPAGLTIYNRDHGRAQALAAALHARFGGRVRAVDAAGARDEAADADLIVNATSAGMDGLTVPLDGLVTRPGAALYDMVYTPSPTPLMRDLAAQGAHVADGLDMLVGQAAASWQAWTGQAPPLGVMQAAALEALRARGVR